MIDSARKINPKAEIVYLGLLSTPFDAQELRWADGTAVDYTNWNGTVKHDRRACVILNLTTDMWNDWPCYGNRGEEHPEVLICQPELRTVLKKVGGLANTLKTVRKLWRKLD